MPTPEQALQSTERGSGRTQAMIDILVSCVAAGQPLSYVVGHNMEFTLHHLLPRVFVALEQANLHPKMNSKTDIIASECIIVFMGYTQARNFERSLPADGWFYDHHVDEREWR
jgi:hypothetical protein